MHRFSNATMPIMNIFKNSVYYWGFAAFVAYNNCHPLYTAPPMSQVYAGLGAFIVSLVTRSNRKHSFELFVVVLYICSI